MKIKITEGRCSGCGRPGVSHLRFTGASPAEIEQAFHTVSKERHMLTSFGGNHICCNHACYLRSRGAA